MNVRINPRNGSGQFGTELGGLAKCGHRFREFVLRLGVLLVRFARLAVDPMQVAVAVAERALESGGRPGSTASACASASRAILHCVSLTVGAGVR